MSKRNLRNIWLPIGLALAGLSACDTGAPGIPGETQLRRMADCGELKGLLEDEILEALVQGRYGYGWRVLEGDLAAEDAPSADGDQSGGEGPTDFTTTNVQEEGVDEIDLVKTDGRYLYVAEDRGFHVVKSWPVEDSEKLATVALDGWAQGLFLAGDKAIVVSAVDPQVSGLHTDRWYGATRVQIIDVSDPAEPKILRTADIDGWLADARLVDGDAYLVLNQYAAIPDEAWGLVWNEQVPLPPEPDWDAEQAEWDAAKAKARDILRPYVVDLVADLDLADVLPAWRTAEGRNPEMMYACGDIYAPAQLSPLSMLSVVRVDPETDTMGSTGLMSDGWTVYASQDNLYIGQASRWWWGFEDEGRSAIHKFSLHADGEPIYEASGEVDGWLYDQFAMSEYQGHLRVVTTDFRNWWGWGAQPEEEADEPANNLFVLKDDGAGILEEVGRVGGIAPGETVQAVRMIKEKGYVVTFEQIDPLFTIDLSEPTNPRIVGELKMPGFSAYLHPIDEDHLLAVGRAGTMEGQITGMAITIFDVSDFAKPRILHELEVSHDNGWSWSEALWDHHAFTYHRDVLTLPMMVERYDDERDEWSGFSGTVSYKATVAGGIQELGRVDHHDLVDASLCLYDYWWSEGDVGVDGSCGWGGYWYAQVRRSVYIEDNLFTISDYGVKVNELNDPDVGIAQVVFYPR